MQKLYLDCDGVILDTINKSYQIMKENNIMDVDKINSFFCNIDWEEFILASGELDGAINKIKVLEDSGLFDIKILTHVNSNNEIEAKTKYFKKLLPNIEVISVPKAVRKADVVVADNAILVDDYMPNLDYWDEKGGISVKFSDSGKISRYITITDLLDLLNIDFKYKTKVKQVK